MQENNRVHATLKRGDIQGLRAIAVVLVVVYHYFPEFIPGGFVGVDVFFVISGFLITLLLIKEIDCTGRISMRSFYARRIRRLLPASLTVTIATVVVAAQLLGPLQLAKMFEDAAWATAYLANYNLAQSPEGYFAASSPSLFTHFWSLAVEEQYYLVWPLILTGIVLSVGARWRKVAPVVLAAVLVGSLVASVVLTASGSNDAYYSLGTRAWELAIGGAVAFAVFLAKRPPSPVATSVAAVLGLAAILASAYGFSELTPFPSWTAAIPTLGTALVIWAGSHEVGDVSRVLGLRPLRFVGDISYSLYLWHWPVLILGAGFVAPGNAGKAALLLLSVALAIGTYYGIERGVSRFKMSLPAVRVIAIGALLTIASVACFAGAASSVATTGGPAVSSGGPVRISAELRGSEVVVDKSVELTSPGWLPENVEPSLEDLPLDLAIQFNGCMGVVAHACEGGDPSGDVTVVLAGDSQAGHLWPALDRAALDNNWKLYGVAKSGCPLAAVAMTPEQEAVESPGCALWRGNAVAEVAALKPDVIIYANRGYGHGFEGDAKMSAESIADWSAGVPPVLDALTAAAPVLYVGRFPTASVDVGDCLYRHVRDVDACATPIDVALPPPARDRDVALAAAGGATYFDPSALVCDAACPVVDDNRIMYRDSGHLSATYSRHLAPALATVVEAALTAR